MKKLDEVMVLGVIINNNLMGGYYLNVTNEKMEILFRLESVKDYADYVRANRSYIDATIWFISEDVNQNIIDLVHKEANSYPDLLLVL